MTVIQANPVSISTDVVIFSIRDGQLKLLLIRRGGAQIHRDWALPGGFLRPDEDLETGARRELAEQTGLGGVYLEQLYTFGAPHRDPRGRVISVAYYALIPSDQVVLQAATDADEVAWFALKDLPDLAFDHDEIVTMAHNRLAAKLDYSTLAFQFMGPSFTLSELQEVYETILQEDIDKRNFRKWVLALEGIEETGEVQRIGAHRPAKLYRIKEPDKVQIIK